MVGREVEQIQTPHERYKPEFIITTWREKGRVWGEGFHIATGNSLKVKLRGRSWMKVKWPGVTAETEQTFWNEFAAYKAQYLKRQHYKRTGLQLVDDRSTRSDPPDRVGPNQLV